MKKILFDLDGTLLPMVQDEFVRCYYGLLLRKLEPFHVDGKKFIDALNYGAYLMTLNDGTDTNEHVFWKGYNKLMGEPDEKMNTYIKAGKCTRKEMVKLIPQSFWKKFKDHTHMFPDGKLLKDFLDEN